MYAKTKKIDITVMKNTMFYSTIVNDFLTYVKQLFVI